MSVRVDCPECGSRLLAPDGTAGKSIKCPGCASPVAVPGESTRARPTQRSRPRAAGGDESTGPGSRPRPADWPAHAGEGSDVAGRERPHGQRPADGRDTGTTLGYVTVLLLLAAICVLLATRADPSYILLPGVGIAFALVFLLAHTQQQKLVAARRAYRASLDRLRAAPNDAALRQEALKLGRRYAARVRGEPGGRVFDEAAIKNDIDATCAGAVHVTGRSVEERLAKLKNLLDAQHITEDEYRQKRQAILDEL